MDFNSKGYGELKVVLRCSSENVCLHDDVLSEIGRALSGKEKMSGEMKKLLKDYPEWADNVLAIIKSKPFKLSRRWGSQKNSAEIEGAK